jgi:RNA polymerase sigma-70 factor (ECF subfamily)
MKSRPTEDEARILELASPPAGDRSIVEGLKRLDPAAAEALYDRFEKLVNGLVWKLMGDDLDHDDIVHQVFVSIISSIGGLENPAVLGSWIISTTFNTVRKEIRSRKIRRILRLMPDAPELPTEDLGPEKQAVLRSFYSVVDRLPAPERMVFILRFIEGYTVGEIATICKCSDTTVKRKIAGARKRFERESRKDPFMASFMEREKR